MRQPDLIPRTREFALAVIKLCTGLPNRPEGWILGKQLMRSGTSIGANYREAQRARTKAEFQSKIHVCRQEAEETLYWLELVDGAEIADSDQVQALIKECQELRAIFTAISLKAES